MSDGCQANKSVFLCTQLSRDLTSHEHKCITDVLHRNTDLFAWQPSDMLGIHPSVIYHKLAICPKAKPISQKKKKMGEERHKVVREVRYSIWLANVIKVKKSNNIW